MFIAGRSYGFKARAFVVVVLLFVLTVVASRLWQFGVASPFTDPLDFRAFYCAGAAVDQGRNPYRVEPDRSCQWKVLAAAGLPSRDPLVLPAPFPPYAIAAFAALALLPYRLATALWFSLNLVALFASIALVNRLCGVRPWIVGLSLFFSAGLVCLSLGQPVPLVLAAVLFATLCARRGNGLGAAIGATIAALEPHLALPVWLALGFFVPRARKPLVAAAAVLGAMTLLPGPALNMEYVRTVIPQHARAELLNFEGQYGLSSLLVALHVPADSALRSGSACYAFMLAFGLSLGVALQRRTADSAFVVAAPLAAVVLGGPFLHIQQTVVAIPLGFMLAGRVQRYSLALGAIVLAIFLLAVPWPLADIAQPSPAPARGRETATATLARRPAVNANESIEIPYASAFRAFERRPDKHSFCELVARKTPTWFALILLLLSGSWFAFAPRRMSHVDSASESSEAA